MLFKTDTSLIGLDTSTRSVRFVIGCLVFILTLIFLGTMAFQKYIEAGSSQLRQRVIFDINGEGQDPETFDQTLRALQQNLSATKGILDVEILSSIGNARHFTLTANTSEHTLLSQDDILINMKQVYPKISLQPQVIALSITDPIYKALFYIAISLMILAGGTMVLSITLVTRTGLSMQQSIVDILRLIGAPNAFIAKQFQWFAFRMSFLSSLLGVLFAFILFFSFSLLSGRLGLPEHVSLLTQEPIIGMAVLPFAIALLALVVARIEVVRTLIRLDQKHT